MKQTIQYALACTMAVVMAGAVLVAPGDQYTDDEHVHYVVSHGVGRSPDCDED